MEIGPIKATNGVNPPKPQPPLPPKPKKVYSMPFYCSINQHGTKLLLRQEEEYPFDGGQGGAIYTVIHKKNLSNGGSQTGSETEVPPGGSVRGDTDCLNCNSRMSVYCNGCERWYCGATLEEQKTGSYHTCPIHGRARIAGTKVIQPHKDPKKK